MKLLGNRILVKPEPQQKQTSGGIMLAEAYNDNQMYYRVVAVGTKVTEPLLKPGARIITHAYQSRVSDLDGTDHRVIEADQVMAVVGEGLE